MNPWAKLPFAHMWLSLPALRPLPCICSTPEKKHDNKAMEKRGEKNRIFYLTEVYLTMRRQFAASYDKATLLVMQQ